MSGPNEKIKKKQRCHDSRYHQNPKQSIVAQKQVK